MKPRYYKHWWAKDRFDWYRIEEDGTIYTRKRGFSKRAWGKWFVVKDGHFATLPDYKMQYITEEDYFLEQI